MAAAFPNVKMRYWMTWEGPLVQEAISVNGELVEIEPWTFVVHVPASDAYQQLLDILNTRDLLLNLWPNRCSIGWRFDKNTETQQTELLAEEVSKQMGNTELLLYCYLDGCPDLSTSWKESSLNSSDRNMLCDISLRDTERQFKNELLSYMECR